MFYVGQNFPLDLISLKYDWLFLNMTGFILNMIVS